MRVLVTGSRDWPSLGLVTVSAELLVTEEPATPAEPKPLTLVEVTTPALTRRHLADADGWIRTLCGLWRAERQADVDMNVRLGWCKPTVVAELQACARCEKSRARLVGAS